MMLILIFIFSFIGTSFCQTRTDSYHNLNTGHKDSIQLQKKTVIKLHPFNNIYSNTLNSFKGKNALLHMGGIASTYLLIELETDYQVQHFFHERERLDSWFMPVAPVGVIGPVAIGAYLYFAGKRKTDIELTAAGYAVLQSSLITFSYISLLKVITGRPHPDANEFSDKKETSRTFNFGFSRGGIFHGWPSGHAGATMAVVSSLTTFYPEKKWIKIIGTLAVGYMTIGVAATEGGSMHWLSDAIAANLMAYTIGSTVGRYYRKLLSGNFSITSTTKFRIMPFYGQGSSGLMVTYIF